ncbi:secretion activator protein [Ensifer sp. ENS04]|uniref:glycoside hydrolase family 108 protein n=1 Tax=Ensifer sp. ENS04 TaxID=2769281 RepID=UPI00178521D3|nr:glycosyl hydrolase 108 family protein [Ensifer sp. ENS04]MBD9539916.1 secretion activator protein [Ensifer sp. ENS04]
MKDRFDICHPVTAGWEGGWSDHPDDPGGKTMYGITEVRWHEYQDRLKIKRTPVKNITKAQALTFYRSEFWQACGAPKLFPGVDLAVYDASVHSGVSRGRKWLIGAAGSSDHRETVKRICRARLSFMQSIKIWKTFGKGWGRRVADIEVRGVAMALSAMGVTESGIKAEAKAEAEAAQKAGKGAAKTAATSAGGAVSSGAAPIIEPSVADPSALWLFGILFVVLAAGAAVLIIRKRAAEARAEAYGKVAA